jgi:hypothetical protein
VKLRLAQFLFLALVMLFAQQGAALHALSHATEQIPGQSQQDKKLPHSPVCDKCVAFAELAGAVHSNPLHFNGTQSGSTPFETHAVPSFVYHQSLYRSRAPPVLA